jgi:hypothetical protein
MPYDLIRAIEKEYGSFERNPLDFEHYFLRCRS